jgi:hypothetical protein
VACSGCGAAAARRPPRRPAPPHTPTASLGARAQCTTLLAAVVFSWAVLLLLMAGHRPNAPMSRLR